MTRFKGGDIDLWWCPNRLGFRERAAVAHRILDRIGWQQTGFIGAPGRHQVDERWRQWRGNGNQTMKRDHARSLLEQGLVNWGRRAGGI